MSDSLARRQFFIHAAHGTIGVSTLLGLQAYDPFVRAAEAKVPSWRPLMDGKTLAGWHTVGDGTWTVEDGAFVGRANMERHYGLLFSDRTFKDFTVRLKFKCLGGDSGFYIRTILKEPDQAHGLQIQIAPPGKSTGGVYESYGRKWIQKPADADEKKFNKANDWNDMTIAAQGGHIVVHVNGVKTADLANDPGRADGRFALQMHAGKVMTVLFKDIEIQE